MLFLIVINTNMKAQQIEYNKKQKLYSKDYENNLYDLKINNKYSCTDMCTKDFCDKYHSKKINYSFTSLSSSWHDKKPQKAKTKMYDLEY